MGGSKLKLSVIVPTRNRARTLDRMLQSVSKQSMDKDEFEVIVIDNGSTDQTKAVCEKYGTLFRNYQYLYDEHPGLHVGRNKGYEASNSGILVYADDDIIAPAGWLEGIWEIFETTEAVEVTGGALPLFEGKQPEWIESLRQTVEGGVMLLDFSCIELGQEVRRISSFYAFGCNMAVKKSVLDAAGGFHPDGMPDELLQYRGDGESYVSQYITDHRLEVWYTPKAAVGHIISEGRLKKEYIRRIAFRSGISDTYTNLRNHKKQIVIYLLANLKQLAIGKDMQKVRAKGHIGGCLFLCRHYFMERSVKEWIFRENYLKENGYLKTD